MLIHIIIAVWSEKYIGLMRDYALPSLLYANNLGSVAGRHKCVLVLYCKEEEEETINKIPALELIRNLCEVEIVHIDPENAPSYIRVHMWLWAGLIIMLQPERNNLGLR